MPHFKAIFSILFLFTISVSSLVAQKTASVQNFINHKDWSFVENRGQLTDSPTLKGEHKVSDVKYYSHEGGAHIYCRPGKISFVFTKLEKEPNKESEATGSSSLSPAGGGRGWNNTKFNHKPSKSTASRIDLILLNSNPSAQITATDQQDYYENFYLDNCSENGITNVHSFKTINYKNIYPSIDLRLHSIEGGMKYEFIVYPNGKVNDIQLQWEGLDQISKLNDGSISYVFPLGSIKENKPYTYQGGKEICTAFAKTANKISFNISKYDITKPLVIDPTLIWSTYFGGNNGDQGLAIATDNKGNAIITGLTLSTLSIATNGAYQTGFGGSSNTPYDNGDAFIAKFSPSCNRLWSTYFGGSGYDYGNSIATDNVGNIFITGQTSSDSGIASTGTYQTSFGGIDSNFIDGGDAFIAKFSEAGNRFWSTYFGGIGNDVGQGISIDLSGNVLLTGYTSSHGLASQGAYQTNYADSNDAFIAKFNPAGNEIWCTYYGGDRGDIGYAITADQNNNIYVTGTTTSYTGIATNGAFQTSYGGRLNGFTSEGDAFIAKFSSSGNLMWGSYFGGSGEEFGMGIATDASSNIFITGWTESTSGIASDGAYQTYGLISNAYLAKFSSSGSREWSTYYSGNEASNGYAIALDQLGNVFITGLTYSNKGIASPGVYDSILKIKDAFIARFSTNGNRTWGSYYGGINQDEGYGIATDHYNNVFITGWTTSTSGLASNGAYQTNYVGNTDAFIAKFSFKEFNDAGISGFIYPKDTQCPGNKEALVLLKNYGSDTLKSVTIYWKVNGKLQIPHSWSGSIFPDSTLLVDIGSYNFFSPADTIIAWTSNPNGKIDSVPENDTAKAIFYVYQIIFSGIGKNNFTICTGSHIKIGADAIPGNTYQWTSVPAGFTSKLAHPVINPIKDTKYYLTETNTRTGCSHSDSSFVSIRLDKAPRANTGGNKNICNGTTIDLGSGPTFGARYIWVSNPKGFSSTSSDIEISPKVNTIYILQVTDTIGCTNLDSAIVYVHPNPNANTAPNQSVCAGTVVSLGAASVSGDTYSWYSDPIGFTSSLSNPVDTAYQTKSYNLIEMITGTGCSAINSVTITVVPRPIAKIHMDSIDAFTRKFSAINPNYPANLYKWHINDSDTSSGYSVIHTFTKIGKYNVTLTASIPGFCTIEDTLNGIINPPFSLVIFPNPYGLQTDLRYVLPNAAHIRISIVDMLGRDITTLLDKNLDVGEYNTPFNATVVKARPGMYLVLFMIDNKLITRKIVQLESEFY